ncbi:MAG: T9SS type A sorting domain-containing protein, partial [Bacteroidota bacterium]
EDCVAMDRVVATATDLCADLMSDSASVQWWVELFRIADDGRAVFVSSRGGTGMVFGMGTGPGQPGDEHLIRWQASDGCGNVGTAETRIHFIDGKNPTPVCIQDLSTSAMNVDGTTSIWAEDFDRGSFDNCSEVKFGFLVDANGELTDDLDEGLFVPSVDFDCDDLTAGQSGTVNLRMYVIDDFGNSDFCNVRLRIDDNPEVDACPDGNLEAALIAGELRTAAGDMVEAAEVTLSGASKMMLTEVDGKYGFSNSVLGNDYEVAPTKDGDYLNGVTTLDLVMIQRHILGLKRLDSPYQMIAADVSGDERISAIDMIELRKVLLGITDGFRSNTSWRFVDASEDFGDGVIWPFTEVISIENLSTNRRSEDFIGVKVGDVSGDAIANSAIAAGGRSQQVLTLEIEDRRVQAGERIAVPIRIDRDDIVGLQMTMETRGLRYSGVESGTLEIRAEHIGVIDEETVTIAYHNVSAPTAGETAFTLYFEVAREMTISEAIIISSAITKAKAYNTATTAFEVNVAFDVPFVLSDQLQLEQNKPNPFRDATDISFVLPQAGEATLTVFDMAGKMLYDETGSYSVGRHTVTIDKDELGVSSGVLYYQIESSSQVATRRMLIIE